MTATDATGDRPLAPEARQHLHLADTATARNYSPLPVVLTSGQGAWVTDVGGRRYLDCLAGYSALNFGHGHPRLLAAARDQLERLTLTSRAFHNDRLGPFCRDLAELAGMDLVLPMNTGAEAVETALKVGQGHPRQGHSRLHDPPRPAPGRRVRRTRLDGRTARRGARRTARLRRPARRPSAQPAAHRHRGPHHGVPQGGQPPGVGHGPRRRYRPRGGGRRVR